MKKWQTISLLVLCIVILLIIVGLVVLFMHDPRSMLVLPTFFMYFPRYPRPPPGAECTSCKEDLQIEPVEITVPVRKYQSGKHNSPFVGKAEHFPESAILERNWKVIRGELDQLLRRKNDIPKFHELDARQSGISSKDNIPWRVFVLKAFGKWTPNTSKCPETTKLLKQIDDKISIALFSILDPGKVIPPHCGPFKTVYRYHLALKVPQPENQAYIIVDDRKYYWKNGEGVLFDDTFRHEVKNESNETRVVLFIDVYRKDIPNYAQNMYKFFESMMKYHPSFFNKLDQYNLT